MPQRKLPEIPKGATPKPPAPAGSDDDAWRVYLTDVLGWLVSNEIPATIEDFCGYAGISRSTLGRRFDDVREMAFAYSQRSYPSRSRPRPPATRTQRERLEKRVWREHERLGAENKDLKRSLDKAQEEVERLRALVEPSRDAISQLQTFVDTLLYELCREDEARAKEVAALLRGARDRTIPAEFVAAIQQRADELLNPVSGGRRAAGLSEDR